MARAASGTYSLASGNPVVTSTTISITWANDTLTDLGTEMTDSLSRSGNGGMLAPLLGVVGTVSLPMYSWTAEPSTGLYRASAGNIRFSLLGVDLVTYVAAGVTVDGSVGANFHSLVFDADNSAFKASATPSVYSAGVNTGSAPFAACLFLL